MRTSVLLALVCAIPFQVARAGQPLQTEDAGVLDRGSCEIEGVVARFRADGARDHHDAGVQYGCGVGVSTQLALAVSSGRFDGLRTRGIQISGKTTLWSGEAASAGGEAPALALAYSASALNTRLDSWRYTGAEFNLAYSRPLPSALTLHANLGHARDHVGRERGTTWGLALEHAGFGACALMAELFGDDRAVPSWNVGLRYSVVPDTLGIGMSYGRQIVTGRPSTATVGVTFGF